MEFKNYKKIDSFISIDEKEQILSFINTIKINQSFDNQHIQNVASKLNGNAYMFDLSNNKITEYFTKFQSSNNICNIILPQIFYDLINKISLYINIPKDNVFLQILDSDKGGFIHPHYDTSLDGYICYKANISVRSSNYNLYLDNEIIDINEGDLYCFEASLYKHWTDPFISKRVILSYGFILEYKDLNRDINDPRVRMSKSIEKYFQKRFLKINI